MVYIFVFENFNNISIKQKMLRTNIVNKYVKYKTELLLKLYFNSWIQVKYIMYYIYN